MIGQIKAMGNSRYITYFEKGSDDGDCTCVMKFRLCDDAKRTVEKSLGKPIEDSQRRPLGELTEMSHYKGKRKYPLWKKVKQFLNLK